MKQKINDLLDTLAVSLGEEECVVVAGELDAPHEVLRGYSNVLVTTGGQITEFAVKDYMSKGFKRFNLLFNNDEARRGFIRKSIDIILKAGGDPWVASLPTDVKDFNEYICKYVAGDFTKLLSEAQTYYLWLFNDVVAKYEAPLLARENKDLTPKERSSALEDFASIINSPYMKIYDRVNAKAILYKVLEQLNVSFSDFSEYVDREYIRKGQDRQLKNLSKVVDEIKKNLNAGDVNNAIRILREEAVNLESDAEILEFAEEFSLPSKCLDDELASIKPGVPIGYKFKDKDLGTEELTLNVGLTFVAAPTSHGKTTALNNLVLNILKRNAHIGNRESVLYYTYEVSSVQLKGNLLNTYVNDPDMAKLKEKSPLNAIYDYARNRRDLYFNRGKVADTNESHYQYFIKKKKDFEKYLDSGALCISEKRHSISKLVQAIRTYVKHRNTTAVFIDYIQLVG